MDLFSNTATAHMPLAARLRPVSLDDYVGQTHLLAADRPLRLAAERGVLYSMVLWGPPGVGKTTLAHLLAKRAGLAVQSLSAVTAGVREIRQLVEQAQQLRLTSGKGVLVFIDEIHRFNKAQQDALLPHLEEGLLTLIGATTENPSFELNAALLSRVRVHVLKPLAQEDLLKILRRALEDPMGLQKEARGNPVQLSEKAQSDLLAAADGDARRLLNLLESAADLADAQGVLPDDLWQALCTPQSRRFDKAGSIFYEQISALHKSVRGSAPDAALYWYARMLEGGCDPFYIIRRLVRMASEDVGNADPRALEVCLNAWAVQERLGNPEGPLAGAQAVLYLACAPKSNAVYKAFNAAQEDAAQLGSLEVPPHLRNAPTALMEKMGYGQAYRYAHDEPQGYAAGEDYFPENMPPRQYYHPVGRGLEQKISDKLAYLKTLDASSSLQRRKS